MTAIAGIRLTDLAKELKMTTPELVTTLKDLGVSVAGAAALLDPETANTVRGLLGKSASTEKIVEVPANATLKELAEAMGVQTNAAVKKMMDLNQLVGPHQRLPRPLAELLAGAYGFTVRIKVEPKPTVAAIQAKHKAPGGALSPRPPIVTIMGHVDHGKTTLLDAIRKTNVVEGEFGGITQHIGAYQVEVDHNGEKRKITFLDTPGHAAFTAMRQRGASVTDIVILVVAADDGIMPQTVEAIEHAQAAKVPIIVAINKMDKPDATPDRVKTQLTEHNLVVEEYGGDVIAVPISAKTGTGINDLLDYILLLADVAELKADPSGHAIGAIVEAKVAPGRGPVATMLVQSGTLRAGDAVVAGVAYGKVRAMTNDKGEKLVKAPPSTPVEIIGLNAAPSAGDVVEVVKSDKEARAIAERRMQRERVVRMGATGKKVTLADLSKQVGPTKDFNVIVKGDVQGSVEAVVGQLYQVEEKKKYDEVRLVIKASGVGTINESDIQLAEATDSTVIGFNVRSEPAVTRAAERDGVAVWTFNIIYDLVEAVEKQMKKLLTPIYEEVPLGKAEVRAKFKTSTGIYIAGSYVTEGKIVRGAYVRLRRGKDIMNTAGRIESLKRVKDDVREVAAGYECGITIGDWKEEYQPGDILEVFEMREIERD
jgi:translation initiation factor IF-2